MAPTEETFPTNTKFGPVRIIGDAGDYHPDYVMVRMVNPFNGNVVELPMRREFIKTP